MNRILIFIFVALFLPTVLFAEALLTVALEQENIRTAPNQKVLGVVFQNIPLIKLKRDGAWSKIRFEGWVESKFLFPLKRNKKQYSVQEKTHVYASVKGKIGGNLAPQTSVMRIKKQKQWSFIKVEGWMWNSSLSKPKNESPQEVVALSNSIGSPPKPAKPAKDAPFYLDRMVFSDWSPGKYIRANGAIRNHSGYALSTVLRMELTVFGKDKKILGSSIFHTAKKHLVRDNGVAIFDAFIRMPFPASEVLSYQYRILQ